MEKSKASWQLRNALKHRTRKWRRRQVVVFYASMLLLLVVSLGATHRSPLFVALLISAFTMRSNWQQSQRRIVTGLDDRAQVEHGMNFDELSETQQHEILSRRLLLHSIILDGVADERQETRRLQANDTAFRFLRPALLCFAAAYWAVYLWLPAGDAKAALTDSPVVISGLVVLVVTLPAAIEMWTEPDEPGEPQVIGNAIRARQV